MRRASKKAGHQEIGRSRGGLSTKIHAVVDALGNPVRWILTSGNIADIGQAQPLQEGLHTGYVLDDKGYYADALVQHLRMQGTEPVIPPRNNRLVQREYDRHRNAYALTKKRMIVTQDGKLRNGNATSKVAHCCG